jgi:hypothetical protein
MLVAHLENISSDRKLPEQMFVRCWCAWLMISVWEEWIGRTYVQSLFTTILNIPQRLRSKLIEFLNIPLLHKAGMEYYKCLYPFHSLGNKRSRCFGI